MAVWSRQIFLQGGHLNWHTWKKIVHSQHLLKTKDSHFFFCERTNKTQGLIKQPLKTLNRLNVHDLSGNGPQIQEYYWSVCKTLENLLFQKML